MSERQRKIILLVGGVLLLMVLFPPFHYVGYQGLIYKDGGYSFIASPPTYTMFSSNGAILKTAIIDYKRLLLQVVMAVVVGGIGFAISQKKD